MTQSNYEHERQRSAHRSRSTQVLAALRCDPFGLWPAARFSAMRSRYRIAPICDARAVIKTRERSQLRDRSQIGRLSAVHHFEPIGLLS